MFTVFLEATAALFPGGRISFTKSWFGALELKLPFAPYPGMHLKLGDLECELRKVTWDGGAFHVDTGDYELRAEFDEQHSDHIGELTALGFIEV